MGKRNGDEITVRIKGSLDSFYELMKERDYKIIDEFILDDTFFISNDLDISNLTSREILAKAILVREVTRKERVVKLITVKKKEFDEKGFLIKNDKIECDVLDIQDAKRLLNIMGYREIMNIYETDKVFSKDKVQFAVKDIRDGDNLIEMEIGFNEGCNSLEDVIEKINDIDIPIYTDDYFIQKAEYELDKVLNKLNKEENK